MSRPTRPPPESAVAAARLDPISRVLVCRGARVRLTPAQTSVLMLLAAAAPDPVPAEAIWEAVLGGVPAHETAAVRVLIHGLRRACREALGDELVGTVRGMGYRTKIPVGVRLPQNVSGS